MVKTISPERRKVTRRFSNATAGWLEVVEEFLKEEANDNEAETSLVITARPYEDRLDAEVLVNDYQTGGPVFEIYEDYEEGPMALIKIIRELAKFSDECVAEELANNG